LVALLGWVEPEFILAGLGPKLGFIGRLMAYRPAKPIGFFGPLLLGGPIQPNLLRLKLTMKTMKGMKFCCMVFMSFMVEHCLVQNARSYLKWILILLTGVVK
jgi:hypothetical protein